MTFRVIEGGGRAILPPAGTVEEARAEIIDRVAAAIWHKAWPREGDTWAILLSDAAEGDSLACLQLGDARNMARAAIGAFKSVEPHDPEYMLFCRGMGLNPEEYADASTALDLFVDEVLR